MTEVEDEGNAAHVHVPCSCGGHRLLLHPGA